MPLLPDAFSSTDLPSADEINSATVFDGIFVLAFGWSGTGQLNLLGEPSQMSAVPEPGTALLLGLGLVGLAARRRTRALALVLPFVLLITPSLAPSGAHAATLNVVGGQLVGASGVDVGGTLYDVEFVDDSCIAIFDGCDSVSDFAFATHADAQLAAQARLDQVFLDGVSGAFDSDPSLTLGCDTQACSAVTPYAFPFQNAVPGRVANNNAPGGVIDNVQLYDTSFGIQFSLAGVRDVYAVWTLVPDAGQTDPGTGVAVEPEAVDENGDPVVGAPAIAFDFDQVTGSGEATVVITETGPPPPQGLKLGNPPIYFDLDTTATFTGAIEVCIDYSGISYGGSPENFALFRDEGGTWADATTTNDTVGMIICASVTSLSFFAIFEPALPLSFYDNTVGLATADFTITFDEPVAFHGFTGIIFDEIQIVVEDKAQLSYRLDNLQVVAAPPLVPSLHPIALYTLLPGLLVGSGLLMLRRNTRRGTQSESA